MRRLIRLTFHNTIFKILEFYLLQNILSEGNTEHMENLV